MARILFYEKPGCGTNARQKRLLEQAGHQVEARSLLAEPWTAERLAGFFGDLPVPAWFNPAAPRVKSGEVAPDGFSASEALELLVAEHLLIHRPLVEVEGQRCAGFDGPLIAQLLGDAAATAPQGCSRPATEGPCPAPAQVPAPTP